MTTLNRLAETDILMVFLAIVSVALLFLEVVTNLSASQQKLLTYIDLLIAFTFLAEFFYSLYKAPNRRHFFRKYWWELLAAIPFTTPTTQALRVINIVRLLPLIQSLRIVRLIVRFRIILFASNKFTRQTALIYVMLLLGIVIISGALIFYHYEAGVNPRIHSIWDSFYWATITTATVGYGDIYPVTTGGRFVAIALIFSGIGTLGAFITIMESYIIKKEG